MNIDMISPRTSFYRNSLDPQGFNSNDNENNDYAIVSKIDDQEMEINITGHKATLNQFNMYINKHVMSFEMESNIKCALFSHLSNRTIINNSTILSFEKYETTRPNAILVITDTILTYFCFNGEIKSCKPPCNIDKAWAVRNGIIVERKDDNEDAHFSHFFTTHHLSEFTPIVYVEHGHRKDFMNDGSFRILTICEKSLLMLGYDIESERFSLWRIRDAYKTDFEKLYRTRPDGLIVSRTGIFSRGRISRNFNDNPEIKKRARPTKYFDTSVEDLDPRSPFVKSLLSVIGDNKDDTIKSFEHQDRSYHKVDVKKDSIEPLYPKICFEFVHFFKNLGHTINKFGPGETTKEESVEKFAPIGFFMKDLYDNDYLCIIKRDSKKNTLIIRNFNIELSSNIHKNDIFKSNQENSMDIRDCVYLSGLRMLVVLDVNGELKLYSGFNFICLISLLTSLSPSPSPTPPSSSSDSTQQIVALSEPTDLAFTLHYSNLEKIRIYLPTLTRVLLISQLTQILQIMLPQKLATLLISKWYIAAPHNESIPAQTLHFFEFLLENIGFRTPDQRASDYSSISSSSSKRFKPSITASDCEQTFITSPFSNYTMLAKNTKDSLLYSHAITVLKALHIVYEAYKINHNLSNRNLILLAHCSALLAYSFNVPLYLQYYLTDYPQIWSSHFIETPVISQKRHHLPPPNWLLKIQQLTNYNTPRQTHDKYPIVGGVNDCVIDILCIWLAGFVRNIEKMDGHFYKLTDPESSVVPDQLCTIQNARVLDIDQVDERIVTCLNIFGITREQLDLINPALVSCLNMSIWKCNQHVPGSLLDVPPYKLMGRDDLALQLDIIRPLLNTQDQEKLCDYRRRIIKLWNSSVKSHTQSWKSNTDFSTAVTSHPHALLRYLELDPAIQLLHPDCRIKEAYLMLQTSSMLELTSNHLSTTSFRSSTGSQLDQNMPPFEALRTELESSLRNISYNRTVAMTVGRGMLSAHVVTGFCGTDISRPQPLVLSGRYVMSRLDGATSNNARGSNEDITQHLLGGDGTTANATGAQNNNLTNSETTNTATSKPITITCPSLAYVGGAGSNNSHGNTNSWCNWPEFHNGVATALQFNPNNAVLDSMFIIQLIDSTSSAAATTPNQGQLLSSDNSRINLPPVTAGLVFGLGLTGHLKKLSMSFLAMGLKSDSELTNMAFLLGACAREIGTRNNDLMKFVHFHYRSLLPSSIYWTSNLTGGLQSHYKNDPTLLGPLDIDGNHIGHRNNRHGDHQEENLYSQQANSELFDQGLTGASGDFVSPLTRITGILATGLLNFESGDRNIAKILLREVGLSTRCTGTDQCCGTSQGNANNMNANNNHANTDANQGTSSTGGPGTVAGPEYHSLVAFSAAVSAGFVLLGMGDVELLSKEQNPLELERLLRYLRGGTRFWDDHVNENDGNTSGVGAPVATRVAATEAPSHSHMRTPSNKRHSCCYGVEYCEECPNEIAPLATTLGPHDTITTPIDNVVFTSRPLPASLGPGSSNNNTSQSVEMEASSDDISTPPGTGNSSSQYHHHHYHHHHHHSYHHNRDFTSSSRSFYNKFSNSRRPQPLRNNPPTFRTIKVLEQDHYNMDMTGPCAALCLGLIFLGTNNEVIARHLNPPSTLHELDDMRSPVLCMRQIGRHLILWDSIKPSRDWVISQVPSFIFAAIRNPSGRLQDIQSLHDAYLELVLGSLFVMALKYAGTENAEATKTFVEFLEELIQIKENHEHHPQANITLLLHKLSVRPQFQVSTNILHWALSTIYLSACVVQSGSGHLHLLRLGRYLRSVPQPTSLRNYGVYQSYGMGIGLLFLGGGKLTLCNTPRSAALLAVAFYPRFSPHYSGSRYHLQALRHLYILTTRPRTLCAIDIENNQTVPITALVKMKNGSVLKNARYLRYPPESVSRIDELIVCDEAGKYACQVYKPHTLSWKILRQSLFTGGYFFVQKKSKNQISFDYLKSIKFDFGAVPPHQLIDIKTFLDYLDNTASLDNSDTLPVNVLKLHTKLIDFLHENKNQIRRIRYLIESNQASNMIGQIEMMKLLYSEKLIEVWAVYMKYGLYSSDTSSLETHADLELL